MSAADTVVKMATGAVGGGIIVALIAAVRGLLDYYFDRHNRRAEAATKLASADKTINEAEAIDHETWFRDSREVFAQVKQQGDDCEKALKDTNRELARIRRDLAEVRSTLVGRVDVIDKILPYVHGIPEDELREIRASNRAVRTAIYRVQL